MCRCSFRFLHSALIRLGPLFIASAFRSLLAATYRLLGTFFASLPLHLSDLDSSHAFPILRRGIAHHACASRRSLLRTYLGALPGQAAAHLCASFRSPICMTQARRPWQPPRFDLEHHSTPSQVGLLCMNERKHLRKGAHRRTQLRSRTVPPRRAPHITAPSKRLRGLHQIARRAELPCRGGTDQKRSESVLTTTTTPTQPKGEGEGGTESAWPLFSTQPPPP